jgi:hypothetical protein
VARSCPFSIEDHLLSSSSAYLVVKMAMKGMKAMKARRGVRKAFLKEKHSAENEEDVPTKKRPAGKILLSGCTDIVPVSKKNAAGILVGADGQPLDCLEAFKAAEGGRGLKVLPQFSDMKMEDKVQQVKELVFAGVEVSEIAGKLKLIFDDVEMSKLWGKLKTQIKNSDDDSVRKKWSELKEAGQRLNKNLGKTEVLTLSLCFPKDWEKKMVSSTREISHSESKSKMKRKFYKGELIQIHGFQEATDFIKKGKYKDSLLATLATLIIKE